MSEFALQINPARFRSTNAAWNELCLNDPWSVGYVSTLIETQTFLTKEQWEQFYYYSGQQRQLKVNQLDSLQQKLLNQHTLKQTNPQQINKLDWNLKNLNFQFGRTREQLIEKGRILHCYVTNKGVDITVEECFECVRFRTICETWNGIIVRERNTIKKLREIFPEFEFVKTNGDFDHKYAIDYEISENGKPFCAIQIKPKTYTYNTPYIIKAREANLRKNRDYFNKFQTPVFDVISRADGEIQNPEVLSKIKSAKK